MPEQKPETTHQFPGSHDDRIAQLEKNHRGKNKAKSRNGKPSTADRLADALLAARRDRAAESGQDPALADFREDLFGELRKLIPTAIAQARKGKPALLRILTRYTR